MLLFLHVCTILAFGVQWNTGLRTVALDSQCCLQFFWLEMRLETSFPSNDFTKINACYLSLFKWRREQRKLLMSRFVDYHLSKIESHNKFCLHAVNCQFNFLLSPRREHKNKLG